MPIDFVFLSLINFCFRSKNVSGQILINGVPRNIRQFRKLSRYIMQENLLQPHLTVQEVMELAANLKLGSEVSKDNKLIAVRSTFIFYSIQLGRCRITQENIIGKISIVCLTT